MTIKSTVFKRVCQISFLTHALILFEKKRQFRPDAEKRLEQLRPYILKPLSALREAVKMYQKSLHE